MFCTNLKLWYLHELIVILEFWWLWPLPIRITIKWRRFCWNCTNQSIHYNQIEKYKYNGDNINLFHNNIIANNMNLTKSPYFDIVEKIWQYKVLYNYSNNILKKYLYIFYSPSHSIATLIHFFTTLGMR